MYLLCSAGVRLFVSTTAVASARSKHKKKFRISVAFCLLIAIDDLY